MNEQQLLPGPGITRRHALRLGMAAGAGLAFGMRGLHPAMGQETPASYAGYAHPEVLVTADWLGQHMGDASIVLVGFMPPEEFEAARIPGSVQSAPPPFEVIDTSDASIEAWHESTRQLLGSLGITRDTTVVAYDNGTLFSARLWWILHYLGHESVHILDGGLPAWQQASDEIETGPARSASGGDPYQGEPNADLLAQMDEVMARLDDPDTLILDARTPEEHAEGHIPGAVNLNFPLNAAPDAPKFFKPADELQAMYIDIGATSDKLVIPYCASGVRSAVTSFALYLLGYDNVALYTGSWLEWGEHPDTPKETGEV